ncbi:MAG: DUF503 family protein [Candidatus Eisenbacteria bacterium]|nr:DUF503 family protein [Candidatus Eisenbacteria bacterium]
MVVGIIEIDLLIRESRSLKDRRRVVRSLKDRISSRFNVSVAEVGEPDSRQRSALGVAVVANDRRFVNEVLSKVLALVESEPRAEVTRQEMEIL